MIQYVSSGTLVVDLYTLLALANNPNMNIVTLDHPGARRKDMLPAINEFFFIVNGTPPLCNTRGTMISCQFGFATIG